MIQGVRCYVKGKSEQILRTIFAHFKKWFHAHVKSYASDDFGLQRNFDLKEKHTFRSYMEIAGLGKGLGLSGEEQRLAEVIARSFTTKGGRS